MSSKAHPPNSLWKRSNRELAAIVARCERALLSGTSSHADFDTLIVAERELLRRSGVRLNSSAAEDRRRSRHLSRTSEEDSLAL